MRLQYRRLEHQIHFLKPIVFPTLPSFLFRSILGNQLKRLTCIFRGRPCRDCGLQYTCAYSWIFETPLETKPEILEGRDRGSHPFLIATETIPRQETQTLTLTLTVIGKAIEYYPYLFYALKKAGEIGVLKDRVPFEIQDVRCEGKSILTGPDSIHPTWGVQQWSLHSNQTNPSLEDTIPKEVSIRVRLETPLRLRINGKYTSTFTAEQFFASLYRRAVILCSLYGDTSLPTQSLNAKDPIQTPPILCDGVRIVSSDLRWSDLIYFSSRQRKVLKMGGVVGEFVLKGHIRLIEQSLLRFGELFHVGKNTAFGLGRFKLLQS
ncbi:MAG: CRISPR system precrRNA processing endoribonuclease RAMP protein Cas6 [Spirochaetes bacterium]|nr:CRISPR system precrRNA processing endoribonuclease RAMP protein Cas6 [Spirochaetota bacterium]